MESLSLTLSLGGTPGRRTWTLSLAPLLRVAAVIALCAASYRLGAWRQRLNAPPAAPVPIQLAVQPVSASNVSLSERAGSTPAPGNVKGETQDLITPLNVRDPAALVMAPWVAPTQAPTPPSKPKHKVIPQDDPNLRL